MDALDSLVVCMIGEINAAHDCLRGDDREIAVEFHRRFTGIGQAFPTHLDLVVILRPWRNRR